MSSPDPSMIGWLLLVALTIFAAFAALSVATRAAFEGRAERFVAFTAAFFALLSAPVLGLGYANVLRPAPLAIASGVLSALTIAAASRGVGLRTHVRATARNATEFARLPWDALRIAGAARSVAAIGLFAAMGWIVWTFVLSYYAPSENWDGFFYHEPMVGFAIQNHGFRMVPLPSSVVVQQVNGFPRLCESIALWFCIFTDRRLIEIGNSLAAPGLMVATYLLVRARSRDVAASLGWAAAMVWVPAIYSQLRTTLVDIQVGFFLLAALHFATRPRVGRREGMFGALCLVLLVASKGTALVWAPPIAIVLFVRLFLQTERGGRRAVIGMAAASAVAMMAVLALTMVPNYRAFHNPLWPVEYRIPALGIAWKGLITMDTMGATMSLRDLVATKYHVPTGNVADIISRDYGLGVPWVVAPLFFVSAAWIVLRAARARLRAAKDAAAENALLLVVLCVLFAKLPPGISVARYNIEVIALAMAVIAAACEGIRSAERLHGTLATEGVEGAERLHGTLATEGLEGGSRLHEGVMASALVLSLVGWLWTGFLGGLDMTPPGIAKLFGAPAETRAWMNAASFQMPQETARRREEELEPGDLVVFTQDELFIGVLWNDRFDNRVEYVPFEGAAPFVAELENRCAKWALVGKSGGARAALEAHPTVWQLLGPAVRQSGTMMFHRITPCEGPATRLEP
ncbi:MAG: hypothetical protein U0441_00155 [Polyangiaceae bacterium]